MEKDYVDEMQNRLLGLSQKSKYKDLSVPHVKWLVPHTVEQISARWKSQKRRKILQNAHGGLKTPSP